MSIWKIIINNKIQSASVKKVIVNNGSRCYSSRMETSVIVKGQTINYLKVGNGDKTVFCLPGALGTIWSDFKPQIEGLDRNKFTIIAWDPPGYGFSRPPNRNFSESFFHDDAEIAFEFMQKIGIYKCTLLGWSSGGITSMILTANHPELIDKLVIWGTNAYITPEKLKLFENMKDISKWSDKTKTPLIKLYTEKGLTDLWSGWYEAVYGIVNGSKKGDICIDVLDKIESPTLIVHGDKDPMIDAIHPVHLNDNIKGSILKRFPEGKHNLHLRFAEDFNKIVTDFIIN